MSLVIMSICAVVLLIGNLEAARILALLSIAAALLDGANVIRRAILIKPFSSLSGRKP